jgi:hypothetical protein
LGVIRPSGKRSGSNRRRGGHSQEIAAGEYLRRGVFSNLDLQRA